MLSLVYTSLAVGHFSEADLEDILVKSRSNNARDDLTGVLAYREGRFLQLLEGPLDAVRTRMAAIGSDPRHEDITMLLEEVTQHRQFPEWTMGFERIDEASADSVPGYRATFDDIAGEAPAGGTQMALRQLIGWYASRA
jgi:hypothetical protein